MTPRRFVRIVGLAGVLTIVNTAGMALGSGWLGVAVEWVIAAVLVVAVVRLARAGRRG